MSGGVVNYDMDGTPKGGGKENSYKAARGVAGDDGTLTAAFDGRKAWDSYRARLGAHADAEQGFQALAERVASKDSTDRQYGQRSTTVPASYTSSATAEPDEQRSGWLPPLPERQRPPHQGFRERSSLRIARCSPTASVVKLPCL